MVADAKKKKFKVTYRFFQGGVDHQVGEVLSLTKEEALRVKEYVKPVGKQDDDE